MARIAGIILAGGASKRFGSLKVLAVFKGKPLILRVVEELSSLTDEVYVSVSYHVYERIAGILGGLKPVFDVENGLLRCRGPMLALASSLAQVDSDYYIVVPGDAAWVRAEVLQELLGFSIRVQAPVAPLLEEGYINPLFVAGPRRPLLEASLWSCIVRGEDARATDLFRAAEAFMAVGAGVLGGSRAFSTVNEPSDMVEREGDVGGPRRVVRVLGVSRILKYAYSVGGIDRVLALLSESRVYEGLGLDLLAIHSLVDACREGLELGLHGGLIVEGAIKYDHVGSLRHGRDRCLKLEEEGSLRLPASRPQRLRQD